MTDAEQGFKLLKQTFDKYAAKDGDPTTLTKKELADLLRSELPASAALTSTEVDEFFKVLDQDTDGLVCFKEFIEFVVVLAMMTQ